MAKRREMMEQLAERRKNQVPVRIARVIRTLTMRFVEVLDVNEKKPDGSRGKVLKVVSGLEFEATLRGIANPITCNVNVEVPESYKPEEEMEKSFNPVKYLYTIDCGRYLEIRTSKQASIKLALLTLRAV